MTEISNFDFRITLVAWTGLDNKRNELCSTVITSRRLIWTTNSQPVQCYRHRL